MARQKDSAVILMSGGINSVVAATRVLNLYDAHFLYVNYGQQAAGAEERAVRKLAGALAAKLHIVKLPAIAELSAIEYQPEDDEPAASESNTTDMAHRHAGVMLTILGAAQQLAECIQASAIVCGASQRCDEEARGVDHGHGEPQSRRIFYHAVQTAFELSFPTRRRVEFDLPLINLTREDVVRTGMRAGAPFHLTWTCFKAGDDPCGQCPGCNARDKAFETVGIETGALQTAG